LAAFVSSGFELIRSPGATEPCPKPRILKIRQGKTGELLVYFTPLYRKAVHYELRHGAQSADGMLPETWTVESLLQARRPARIENLTPGTIYVFQVRAFGKTGVYTDWSDSATRMCI